MSHKKRSTSRAIQTAATRAAGLESINPNLDLGDGLTLATYRAALEDARVKQTAYNGQLAQSDQAANVFDAAEVTLRDLSVRMLAAVAGKYGLDSNEYEQAGGTRRSDRKRPGRAAAKASVDVAKAA
jgi:hypothetical protein